MSIEIRTFVLIFLLAVTHYVCYNTEEVKTMGDQLFAGRLKALRIERGFTQAQFAQKLGISASTVGMYEQARREPDNATLAKMCELLQTSTDYLLGISQPEREVDEVIQDFTRMLENQQGLMFNGRPMSTEDREKIAAAIRVAAAVAVSDRK